MGLSKLQKEIAYSKAENIIVLASAAAGKTAVLTERVKWLLEEGADPSKVVVFTFTNAAAEEMRKRIGEKGKDVFINTIHSYAFNLLLKYGLDVGKVAEEERFDDFFKMVKENLGCIEEVDYLLLDEAQDSNLLQFKFIDMINPKHRFIVGDVKQCQPAGTKVLLRNNIIKPIEEVEVGDSVVFYDNAKSYCSAPGATAWNAKHKRVTKVGQRKLHQEEIITIHTESGKKSSYTANHRTFIKINEDTEYEHVVYLMCNKEGRFRVGKIPLRGTKSKSGNPWRAKMTAENCDKIWLLKVFKTDKEARVYEQKISYFYQIPQVCWQTDKVSWTEEDIDYIYEGLDTYDSAVRCLANHDRDIRYPIIDKNLEWSFNQKFASNATSQIYACNIMSEFMDCVIYDPSSSNHAHKYFEHIEKVEHRFSNEMVYSLEVEGGTYVADGIVTHNCIYEWSGARPDILFSMLNDPRYTVYNLNENYRNGPTILRFAKRLISGTMFDDEPLIDDSICMNEFEVDQVAEVTYNKDNLIYLIRQSGECGKWFVLARSNAQVDAIMYALTEAGIPCDTFKRSQITAEEFQAKMAADSVKILTVHAAKGLEADYVYVVGVSKWNQKAEERRVAYVAATRAKKALFWAKEFNKKKRQYISNWE